MVLKIVNHFVNYTLKGYNSGMAKLKKKVHLRIIKYGLLPFVLSILLLALTLVAYQAILANKYFPLTYVGDTNISFLTEGQAIRKVESSFQKRIDQKLQLSFPQGTFTIDLATSSATLDYSALNENFKDSHNGPIALFFLTKITPKINLNLEKQLDVIAAAIDRQPQNAKLVFDEAPSPESTSSSRISVTEGSNGYILDKDQIKKVAADYLLSGKYQSTLPLKSTPPKITTEHVTKAKQILEQLVNEPLKLVFEDSSWTIDAKQLLALLDLESGQNSLLDQNQTKSYINKIASEIDRPVQEGLFEFDPNTHRVSAFKQSTEGRSLDKDQTLQLITDALNNQTKTVTLPVNVAKPKIETSDVNSLGIKELLGRGISNFAGSIPNRIYNVGLTASKITGVLVPPGQTFSFNQTIGDISAATGFKQAYVIKEGRTVLDDGGGVCQDSTTLFRAVLNAGLPVIKRTAHAYRVGYYEQGFPPGIDATVFYPSVDFQFKNDTAAHILIQSYIVGNTLYVDLYGTPDGRLVDMTIPVIANQTPPPPELRQDDPTLSKGTIKQVDWAAWGANVSFKRTVTKNGETLINETWHSNYKPWQAIYLVGTQ